MNIVLPVLDKPKRILWQVTGETANGKLTRSTIYISSVDTRETLYDFPEQKVITKDNIAIKVDALLYYKVVDVKAAVYSVSNLPNAIEKLAQTTLRNVIGSLQLDETLCSRDRINQTLCATLNESIERWGAKVVAVELQEIIPPPALAEAMEKEMKAERTRRAQIVTAEGERSAAIQKQKETKVQKFCGRKEKSKAKLFALKEKQKPRSKWRKLKQSRLSASENLCDSKTHRSTSSQLTT